MTTRDWRKRLIIGITGASGTIYGVRLLQACKELGLETHLCMSKAAELTLSYELEMRVPRSARSPTRPTRPPTSAPRSPRARSAPAA